MATFATMHVASLTTVSVVAACHFRGPVAVGVVRRQRHVIATNRTALVSTHYAIGAFKLVTTLVAAEVLHVHHLIVWLLLLLLRHMFASTLILLLHTLSFVEEVLQIVAEKTLYLGEVPFGDLGHVSQLALRFADVSIPAEWASDTEPIHVVIALACPWLLEGVVHGRALHWCSVL